jgi:hypothetical protein
MVAGALYILPGGEKQLGLGVLLKDTCKQYGFWWDSNLQLSGFESTLTITPLIPMCELKLSK